MAGSVMAPVEATLADADPEIEPNSADEITETLAAPPRSLPAAAAATFMKPRPASPRVQDGPEDDEDRHDVDRHTGEAVPDTPFGNSQGTEETIDRRTRVPELARDVLAEQAVKQRTAPQPAAAASRWRAVQPR